MSLDEILIKYRMTKDDLKMFQSFYLNRIRRYNIFIILYSVLLLFSLLFWIMTEGILLFKVMFFLCLFFLLYFSAWYIIPILRFKEEKVKEITYRFSDEGVQIEGGDTLVKLGWHHYKAVIITPCMYIFRLGPRSYWGLPVDAIPDKLAFDRLIYSQKEKAGLKIKVL
jgi:hypothetical protein